MKDKPTQKQLEKYSTKPTRETMPTWTCPKKSLEEYQKQLSKDIFTIMFKDGTEPAFSHPYHDNYEQGTYCCAACGQPLFGSEAKFTSGTGWPSFYAPLKEGLLNFEIDFYIGLPRTAVLCSCCNGHLGHVFEDGPKPTGLRFCMNGTALAFKKEDNKE